MAGPRERSLGVPKLPSSPLTPAESWTLERLQSMQRTRSTSSRTVASRAAPPNAGAPESHATVPELELLGPNEVGPGMLLPEDVRRRLDAELPPPTRPQRPQATPVPPSSDEAASDQLDAQGAMSGEGNAAADERITQPSPRGRVDEGDTSDRPRTVPASPYAPNRDGGDPLSNLGPASREPASAPTGSGAYNPHSAATLARPTPTGDTNQRDPHWKLLLENEYPSAQTCAKCHPQHYEEWSVSAHAYAMVSPMFQRFEQKITELTQGTVGHFCVRCHGPVATQIKFPRDVSILDAPKIVREGITCVACHRVNEAYGRTNGLRRVEPGDIHQPVNAGSPGPGLQAALARREELKLKIDPADQGPGQPIHTEVRPFLPLSRSDFCATCHQVSVHPGLWLEIVHAQYRSGPAAAKGISCQDCHMGQVPGKPLGYEESHIAELAGKPYGPPQKKSNHMFWGPGYSIAHPGLFPMNAKADRWSPRQWLAFDDRSEWGRDAFERNVAPHLKFPPPWDNTDDRRDARKILDDNQQRLDHARAASVATMQAGAAIEGPRFDSPPDVNKPLRFHLVVRNLSEGHNFPSGSLGAQPQVWLNVALIGPQGNRLWESGYLDTQGDLADLQSTDVATGKVQRDAQLFNLQSKFLVNGQRGTDREVAVPLNFNVDQLVFFRPGAVPIRVLNHPPLIRMEAHSIPPLGSRRACYAVPADRMQKPGVYRLSYRLRSRVEPTYFMKLVEATPDMIRRMNEGILDIHPASHTFLVR